MLSAKGAVKMETEICSLFVKEIQVESSLNQIGSQSYCTNEPIYARLVKVNWVFEVEMLQSGLALHRPPLPRVFVLISAKNAGHFF